MPPNDRFISTMPASSPLSPSGLSALPDWRMFGGEGGVWWWAGCGGRQSGRASEDSVSPSDPKLTAPDLARLESQITPINLGRGRAGKRIMGTPMLRGDIPASPPLDGGPQDLMPPRPNTSWPHALTHSAPFSPAAWPVSTSCHRS